MTNSAKADGHGQTQQQLMVMAWLSLAELVHQQTAFPGTLTIHLT